MRILVINTGSSSIKYQLFDMTRHRVMVAGLLDRIGEEGSCLGQAVVGEDGVERESRSCRPTTGHGDGLEWILETLKASGQLADAEELLAVGHRVVHGGEAFHEPVVIDEEVMAVIERMAPLAPLHNPPNLVGIRVAQALFPGVPQVAVFDTAFHQTMPPRAFRYPLPEAVYRDHGVRRYGFHGTSHRFVAGAAAEFLGEPLGTLNLVTLHLGNGCSAAAIAGGRSVDTSMGMTPLEGLMMGTRCGDLDPAIPFYLEREARLAPDEVERLLNKASGLKGVCGVGDMRAVHRLADGGDERARLALEMFCYRVRKYIGAYSAVLGRVDAVVFTGGIGENDHRVRGLSCDGLENLGIRLDPARNADPGPGIALVSASGSPVKVLKVPTDEELEIARSALGVVRQGLGVRRGNR